MTDTEKKILRLSIGILVGYLLGTVLSLPTIANLQRAASTWQSNYTSCNDDRLALWELVPFEEPE